MVVFAISNTIYYTTYVSNTVPPTLQSITIPISDTLIRVAITRDGTLLVALTRNSIITFVINEEAYSQVDTMNLESDYVATTCAIDFNASTSTDEFIWAGIGTNEQMSILVPVTPQGAIVYTNARRIPTSMINTETAMCVYAANNTDFVFLVMSDTSGQYENAYINISGFT
jgi:hypothetical protein